MVTGAVDYLSKLTDRWIDTCHSFKKDSNIFQTREYLPFWNYVKCKLITANVAGHIIHGFFAGEFPHFVLLAMRDILNRVLSVIDDVLQFDN